MNHVRTHLLEAVFLLLLPLFLLSLFAFFVPQSNSIDDTRPRTVVISRGMDVRRIGGVLEEEGIIPGVLLFIIAARIAGKDFTELAFRDYSTMSVNISAASDAQLHAANKYAYRRFYLSPRRFARIVKVVPKNMRTVINAWLVFRLLFQDAVNQ